MFRRLIILPVVVGAILGAATLGTPKAAEAGARFHQGKVVVLKCVKVRHHGRWILKCVKVQKHQVSHHHNRHFKKHVFFHKNFTSKQFINRR